MERVFADTGYWIALLDNGDSLHERAQVASREMGSCHIVTTEMILTEFLNCFSGLGPHLRSAAVKAIEALRNSPGITIVSQTSALFDRALQRYREMRDKAWSLTDCASFLIMEDEDLTAALTHDLHFAQAGFRALLR